MCIQESKKRKINFFLALVISPLFGYFIILNRPLRNNKGCVHCGNTCNEAEFCGLCGKMNQVR